MTEKEYRADPRLSQSTLKLFSGAEEDYSQEQSNYKLKTPFAPSEAMIKGTFLHSIIENQGNFDRDKFAIAPCNDKRKKEYKEFAAECTAEYIMTEKDLTDVRNMWEKLCLEHPNIWEDIKRGDKEKAFFNENYKALIDLDVDDGHFYDWKKTSDITIRGLRKSCANYGYDFQAYHYLQWGKSFTFVFFQDVAPYEIVVYKCEPEFIQRGKAKWNEAHDRYMARNIKQTREISMLWPSEKLKSETGS